MEGHLYEEREGEVCNPLYFSFSSPFRKYMIGNYNKIPYNVLNG